MEDEAATGLYRSAMVDGAIRCFPRIDVELAEKPSESYPRALVADSDADRAIFIVDAQGDNCPLEPRIGHPRHCKQQLAGQKTGLIGHAFDNATA
jgi:hypothetical protein